MHNPWGTHGQSMGTLRALIPPISQVETHRGPRAALGQTTDRPLAAGQHMGNPWAIREQPMVNSRQCCAQPIYNLWTTHRQPMDSTRRVHGEDGRNPYATHGQPAGKP